MNTIYKVCCAMLFSVCFVSAQKNGDRAYEPVSQGSSEKRAAPSERRATAPPGYHVFQDDQGRTLNAKILQFNKQSGKVKLFLENGTSRTVSPSVFSAYDQDYNRRWFKAQDILSKQVTFLSLKR
jgi:hypothetical protein